jgi:ubiquinone/menaquinone biosynthesis C-methylase UbiE
MSSKANYCCADAENLPVGDQTVDVIMVNGICNLNPFRSRIVTELSRVIKDNGTLYIAELIQKQADQKAVSVFHLKDWFT